MLEQINETVQVGLNMLEKQNETIKEIKEAGDKIDALMRDIYESFIVENYEAG